MRVPLVNLRAQYRALRGEIDAAIARVVEGGSFILGPEVEALEEEIRRYLGVEWAIACGSGTDALHLALRGCGIGPGDEVITAPFTFIATAEAISLVGAVPVFADIDPVTFALDPAAAEAAVTARTRALLPVHLFGHPADLDPLRALSRSHGLVLIEDAAQALGARYKGERVGTIGQVGCFSFFPTKNLGAFGDGGLVAARDPAAAARIRLLRTHGEEAKYRHVCVGLNSRLDALQAAVLRVKLGHLERWNARRRQIARKYGEGLAGCPLQLPAVRGDVEHVYHQYTVRTPARDLLREHLHRRGVSTAVHYPLPLHLQPAYAHLRVPPGSLPESERAACEVLSLPLYPEMADEDVECVIEAVRGYYAA